MEAYQNKVEHYTGRFNKINKKYNSISILRLLSVFLCLFLLFYYIKTNEILYAAFAFLSFVGFLFLMRIHSALSFQRELTKAILKLIGVKCPTCETGEVVERKSKTKRTFYGCNTYPECDFVSWDKPISRPCPKCSTLLVEKKLKKGIQIQCTKCDYEEAAVQ